MVDDFIRCPIADFGCLTDVPSHSLQEHYASTLHQECLMKAIDLYVQNLQYEGKNSLTSLNYENDYSELSETVNILTEGVSCLNDDSILIHNDILRAHSNILEQQKQIEQLKSSVDESVQIAQANQLNNNILQNELDNIKQMMADQSSQASKDGTFIWKITNVAQKISDAAADRQTSIYSAPFYSSPTGYKMCLRLYFNGDGNARRTHLSLFFVLLRGEYDAILQWPFSPKITFCLYNQTKSQHHLIDSFRPDIRSNSFQRPRSNMNIASGIPKFCPLPNIQQENNPYVRDDCMFIRCIVDFASTEKTMLPYICSLNPGLPPTIQQAMIQAETVRRNSVVPEKLNSPGSSPKSEDLK